MTGKTDIDIQISNQCGRLIANVIIYYNSAILSRLLDKYQASKNAKALALLKKDLSDRLAAYLFFTATTPFVAGESRSISMPSWQTWRWKKPKKSSLKLWIRFH